MSLERIKGMVAAASLVIASATTELDTYIADSEGDERELLKLLHILSSVQGQIDRVERGLGE